DGLEGHCRVLNYDGRRLVLRTDSPAWNTLLRYHTPDLLTRLRRHAPLRGLASLHIRTAPATPEAKPRDTAPPRGLGPDTAALVRSLADTMNDERLRLALRRLADRHTTAE
ncbi:MAG TPA: DUF721 domain-containing protein, partial [Chromatiales bacterium]|nr:DUF721 domain-containing protein [Chromatiales bacterium]